MSGVRELGRLHEHALLSTGLVDPYRRDISFDAHDNLPAQRAGLANGTCEAPAAPAAYQRIPAALCTQRAHEDFGIGAELAAPCLGVHLATCSRSPCYRGGFLVRGRRGGTR